MSDGQSLTPAPRSITASGEIASMWRFCRETGIEPKLRRLMRPRPVVSVGTAVLDWALIVAAAAAAWQWGGIAVGFAVVLIGNRQRALGNLLHDASHGSFDGRGRRGSFLANALLCWPLWISMRVYRQDHLAHHRYLSDPTKDPDYIHDERMLSRSWLYLLWHQVASVRMLRVAIFSHLERMNSGELLAVVGWWAMVLGCIAFAFGPNLALGFLGMWFAARILVFHPITAFREISDHVGLTPGSLIGFSRNHLIRGWAKHVFHPHNNGYHLLHHLAPALPYHAFPIAHGLLLEWPPYRDAVQCTSYFFGAAAATRSWVGRGAMATAVSRDTASSAHRPES